MRHFVQEPVGGQTSRVNLRILATTDLHMNILPYDYHADREAGGWGLARTEKLIEAARAEAQNVILLDNGDSLYGSALGEGIAPCVENDISVHPMIHAMNHLRYDAVNLGNHDFDQGRDAVFDAVKNARFPVLTANAKIHENPYETTIKPYTLLRRQVVDELGFMHDLCIGVIGFLPPNSLQQAKIQTDDIVEAALRHIPEMKMLGADVIVVLAHSGLGADAHVPDMENVLRPLSRVPGIDAIIGGHTHQVFPAEDNDKIHPETDDNNTGLLNGVPTVMPGFWGSHLGIVDLGVEFGDGRWKVCYKAASLKAVKEQSTHTELTSATQAGSLESLFSELHETTREAMRASVGEIAKPLDNYFTLVGADSATRLVQMAMMDHARNCQRALGLEGLPVLAAGAAFKSGGFGGPDYYTSLPAGRLTQRSLSDLYMFPNSFELVKVSGAFLRNWLERSCSIFNQVFPSQRAVQLKDDGVPGYIHESVLGLTYEVDLVQPARFTPAGVDTGRENSRVRSLCCNGREVQDVQEFLLATTDYRVLGGGNYPTPFAEDILPVAAVEIRDLLSNYVARQNLIELDCAPTWRFSPVKDASIWFRSSPDGANAAPGYPWLRLTELEAKDARGFTRYELEL